MSDDKVKLITAITQSSVGGQAFHANAMAFPSQAETTLTRYSKGGGYKLDGGSSNRRYRLDDTQKSLGKNDSCFGCNGPHPWMRNKKIVCPNRDKPGMCEEAAKAYQVWSDNYCKRQEHRSKKRKVDYDKMSNANKERVKEPVLASMGIKPSPAKSSSDSPPPSKMPLIFIINVLVLSSSGPSRNILPTPTMSNFPHIHL